MEERNNNIKWHKSISFRISMLFITSFILIIVCVMLIIFTWLRGHMIDEYTHMAEGVTKLMAEELDPDRVDDYIEKNFELEDYNNIQSRFYDLKDSYPNILYMYVYRINPYGADVVFDLDSEFGMDASAPGDIYDLDEPFMEHIDELVVGDYVPPLMGDTPDGYLLTYCRPLFKSDGSYSCHVCVDFSMDKLHRQGIGFSMEVLFFLGIAIILVLLGDNYIMRRGITNPVNRLHNALCGFGYETEDDLENNIRLLEEVKIGTDDEIEELHKALVTAMKESYSHMTNLNLARNDIKNKEELIGKISETAYRDALTGVGSKAAYNEEGALLERELADGKTEFALVVCDINNLKYINDKFGHKTGDIYIIGCCNILREVYAGAPIFRIGGDEFVVILRGKDYVDRNEKYNLASSRFALAYAENDKEMWERYSMSLGMSEPRRDDKSASDVFRRADEAMYKNKRKFKDRFGRYR